MKVLSILVYLFSLPMFAQSLIKIDGSSTVFPITEAMAEEFQNSKKASVRVTVGISGTGGGFKKFCRGETDVQNASRPISTSEMADCAKAGVKFVELPIAYEGTIVAVHPENTWLNEISVEELKKMWQPEAQGKITKWNQVNSAWPDKNLSLYGAGADSGTFDYFTEAIVGKAKASRGDYTPSEDDNVLVNGISQDKYALGFLPMAYFEGNKKKLKALKIISATGKKAVVPSKETVENGTYKPLSRPLFIYVSNSALEKSEVKEFAEFYLANAAKIVPSVSYVSLPTKVYTSVKEHLKKKKLGTVFAGHSEVDLSIDQLMKREGKM